MNELDIQVKMRAIREESAKQISDLERLLEDRRQHYSNFCTYLKSKSEEYRKMLEPEMADGHDMGELWEKARLEIKSLSLLEKKASEEGRDTYFLQLEIECLSDAMVNISWIDDNMS